MKDSSTIFLCSPSGNIKNIFHSRPEIGIRQIPHELPFFSTGKPHMFDIDFVAIRWDDLLRTDSHSVLSIGLWLCILNTLSWLLHAFVESKQQIHNKLLSILNLTPLQKLREKISSRTRWFVSVLFRMNTKKNFFFLVKLYAFIFVAWFTLEF